MIYTTPNFSEGCAHRLHTRNQPIPDGLMSSWLDRTVAGKMAGLVAIVALLFLATVRAVASHVTGLTTAVAGTATAATTTHATSRATCRTLTCKVTSLSTIVASAIAARVTESAEWGGKATSGRLALATTTWGRIRTFPSKVALVSAVVAGRVALCSLCTLTGEVTLLSTFVTFRRSCAHNQKWESKSFSGTWHHNTNAINLS